jgi:hypothetical protein
LKAEAVAVRAVGQALAVSREIVRVGTALVPLRTSVRSSLARPGRQRLLTGGGLTQLLLLVPLTSVDARHELRAGASPLLPRVSARLPGCGPVFVTLRAAPLPPGSPPIGCVDALLRGLVSLLEVPRCGRCCACAGRDPRHGDGRERRTEHAHRTPARHRLCQRPREIIEEPRSAHEA